MGLAEIAVIIVGLAVLFLGWLGFGMFGQIGRLLLRVEDLERSLGVQDGLHPPQPTELPSATSQTLAPTTEQAAAPAVAADAPESPSPGSPDGPMSDLPDGPMPDPPESPTPEPPDARVASTTDLTDAAAHALLRTLAAPATLTADALHRLLRPLRTPALPPRDHEIALTAFAAGLYARPDFAGAATIARLCTILDGPPLTPSTECRLGQVLGFLAATPAAGPLATVLLELLERPSAAPAPAHNGPRTGALLDAAETLLTWYLDAFELDRLVRVATSARLAPFRARVLHGLLEPALLAHPASVTVAHLDLLAGRYGDDPGFGPLLAYLAGQEGTAPNVRAVAAAGLASRLPLRAEVAAQLGRAGARVLIVQNIADNQRDEIVRVVPLLQALLSANPDLHVTLITARPYLYGNIRLTLVPIDEPTQVAAVFAARFDALIDFFEDRVPAANHVPDLEAHVQQYREQQRPVLFIGANTGGANAGGANAGHNTFVFQHVTLRGRPYAVSLGLDRPRVASVYEPTHRLAAHLGLPVRLGQDAPGDSAVLAALPSQSAAYAWADLQTGNTESRPVALCGPFGDGDPLQGYVPATFPDLARRLHTLVADGYFVVLLPNGQAWGSAAVARDILDHLDPNDRAHIVLGPDPIDWQHRVACEGLGDLFVPRAGSQLRLMLAWVQYADLIVGVEDWLLHAAALHGKPYHLYTLPRSDTDAWTVYGRSPGQQYAPVLPPMLGAEASLLDAPPLPDAPRRGLLLFVLRGLAAFDDDSAVRREAAQLLARQYGQQPETGPVPSAHDASEPGPAPAVMAATAATVMAALAMTDASPYAAYHRLQDDAMRHVPPYPAGRFAGRGIVMAAGGPLHFTGAWVVLNVLRRVHNCQLPVQLWYLGPAEMSPQMIELLRPLGVECVDALQVRKRYPVRRLGGWECKPYAIIHSPFEEVIWIDADNTPLLNPELLLSEPEYQRTGALFWPDLTSIPPRHPIWDICRVPWRHEPEFESGQLVVDKARTWNALQLTMHLNEWSDFYYQYVLGDKETFHVAWRMLDQEYGMPARAPRAALGRWPHAPATDGGTITLFQHDFAGREAFHHRTGIAKWSLLGDHLSFDGFPFESFSVQAIAELRERWDGRVQPSPSALVSARTAAEIEVARVFRYIRRGLDERLLELLPGGQVGRGGGAIERTWRLEPGEAGPALTLAGDHGDGCRLSLDDDGVWRGRWLQFERMPVELVPLGQAALGRSDRPMRAGALPALTTPRIKRSLLYLSPVIPAPTGNRLAMRAGAVLVDLADRYAVTLVVVPRYASPVAGSPDATHDTVATIFADRCHRVLVVPDVAEAEAALADVRYDVLHVFRLAMLPAAERFRERASAWHLDLDDIESETGVRLADLAALNGDTAAAQHLRDETTQAAALEARVLREFQCVYVCSERDRQQLAARGTAEIVVLPNVVPVQGPLPPAPAPPQAERPWTLLFVGTLGYLPNADGIRWFCETVLPLLRNVAPCPFRVVIVGTGADDRVRALGSLPNVEVAGAVPDLMLSYRDASAVIVPLRGGGGTRIKVLEAFSYRRPVVSTSIGAEGLEAVHDEHLLIADEPAALAAACARLMADTALAARLTAAAHALFLRAYASPAARIR